MLFFLFFVVRENNEISNHVTLEKITGLGTWTVAFLLDYATQRMYAPMLRIRIVGRLRKNLLLSVPLHFSLFMCWFFQRAICLKKWHETYNFQIVQFPDLISILNFFNGKLIINFRHSKYSYFYLIKSWLLSPGLCLETQFQANYWTVSHDSDTFLFVTN